LIDLDDARRVVQGCDEHVPVIFGTCGFSRNTPRPFFAWFSRLPATNSLLVRDEILVDEAD
jgi:hypothetical protein